MLFLSTARVSEPGRADRVEIGASSDTLEAASTALTRFAQSRTGPHHPQVRVDQTRALEVRGLRIVAHHDLPVIVP